MASKSSLATPRPKDKVPAAARPGTSTFGENRVKPTCERRSPRPVTTEKKPAGSRGGELRQTQEDLAKTKEQLALLEKSKSNLAQDLARSRRSVEDLTVKLHEADEACRKGKLRTDEMEHASFTAAEDWQAELDVMKQQYEAAVLDLQTNKQAMENLKHELEACVKAKDEAVKLAGEAMNAAESTAKKVEELAAELLATKGSLVAVDSAGSRVDELMNELSGARQDLAEATASREKIANEKAAILAARESDLKEVIDAASSARNEIEGLKRDLVLAKKSELQITYLSSTLEHLRSELASAKAAEQKALLSASEPHLEFERTKSEVEAAKTAELTALASLATVSAELEAVQENLIEATVEGATLGSSLEFLKSELKRSQSDVIDLKERESIANLKTEALTVQLTNLMERNKTEFMVMKERESDAYAIAESLKTQLEVQRLELEKLIERESIASASIGALTTELETNRRELVEQQAREMSSVAKVTALTRELESNRVELLVLTEREPALTSKIAALTVELSSKESEAVELKERLFHTDEELNMLNETHQINLLELREREACGTAKSSSMDTELMKLKQNLEEALTVGKLAREEADNLHLALQTANSEKEQARQEVQILIAEAEGSRHDAMVALAELKAARDEVQTASETTHAARLEAHAGAEDIISVKGDAQSAREEAQLPRIEAETINEEERRAAVGNGQMASNEVADAQEEAQSARKEAKLLQTEILIEKEKANAAREEAQSLRADVEKLKTELNRTQTFAQETQASWNNAENGLQDAAKNMETLEVNGSIVQGKTKQYSETGVAVLQEEVDFLKLKLQNAEDCLGATRTDFEAFKLSKEELLRQLKAAKEEIGVHKRAAAEDHQHFAETEKARLIMEVEIQKLLDDSKQWQASQDAIDIPVHSEMNGGILSSESREKKPQPDSLPDSLEQALTRNPSFLHKEEEDQKEHVTQKEELSQKEDAKQKEEVASNDGISLQTKKKKKALLSRLGTYLEKKKNQQTL